MNFDWNLPYPSRRQPVLARNTVATSQPLAVQAGIAMLQRGGNAVDAALAAAIALTVVEPCSNGIGSDLFAILWDGRELVGLNASGRAPAAVTPGRYAGQEAIPQRGWEAVTVPGAVSAWVALSQRLAACRRPFAPDTCAGRPSGRPSSPRAGRKVLPHDSASPSTSRPGDRPPASCELPGDGTHARKHRRNTGRLHRALSQAMSRRRANGALHALPDFAEHTVIG
jgi:hypothetical protein